VIGSIKYGVNRNMSTKPAHLTKLIFVSAIVLLAALLAVPLLAQDGGSTAAYPTNTITVTGTGEAYGAPDIANLVVGVEIINSDLPTAFSEANSRIETIIQAVLAVGVAREDIRTMGLNVYIDRYGAPMPMDSATEGGSAPQNYVVSNQLSIRVRDIAKVAEVINAAVAAGANNLYGLDFNIADRSALESEARVDAMADARARAEHLAEIAGVSLGEIVVINEGGGGFVPYPGMARDMAVGLGGGGEAAVEPGQLSVQMAVTVTYAIAR
jgi:uncharacterized protein